MLDSRFVLLAAGLSVVGSAAYLRDTLRGTTAPHRVTWGLWALEGILAFAVEVQQKIGVASVMTLALGVTPLVIFVASFRNSRAAWKIDAIDIFCGVVSLAGVACWALVNQPTVALVAFATADLIAALPTYRKAWRAPESETARTFVFGAVNTGITLLTLRTITTAGALFPGVIMMTDTILSVVIVARLGPRFAGPSSREDSFA